MCRDGYEIVTLGFCISFVGFRITCVMCRVGYEIGDSDLCIGSVMQTYLFDTSLNDEVD